METEYHSLSHLFEQLGLDNSASEIENFIAQHRPIASSLELSEAEFWNNSQANFLKEAVAADSDWAEVVDQLDAMLR